MRVCKKLQFFDSELQIFDRGNLGDQKLNFFFKFLQNWRFLAHILQAYFWKKRF